MLGLNKRIINSTIHLLVVERSYLIYIKYKYAKISFASNTLKYKLFLKFTQIITNILKYRGTNKNP